MSLLMTITKRLVWFITLTPFFFVGLVMIVYMVMELYSWWDRRDFYLALDEAIAQGKTEIALNVLTDFEWDRVCRNDGYQEHSGSRYVWDLEFQDEHDELIREYTFRIEDYGSGYAGEFNTLQSEVIPTWCVSKGNAVLRLVEDNIVLTDKGE